jgi:dihydropteroate synthase
MLNSGNILLMNRKPGYINIGGQLIDLGKTRVMGILNVTPDSIYSGSRYVSEKQVLEAAERMLAEGADFLDVGGYSSRPGAADITPEVERERVLSAVKAIKREFPGAIVSIDTFRAAIAREAICEAGADIINDISGGEADPAMFGTVQELNVPYVMMHMRGTPRTMQDNPVYEDVVSDIIRWFGERIVRLNAAGVNDIIIDPGFGFGKTIDQNFELLRRLGEFSMLRSPLMVGVSRKSMIWKSLGISAGDALNGTTALHSVLLLKGADILRVHDVKEAVETVRLIEKIGKESE